MKTSEVLRERLHELDLKLAKYGISADPSIPMEIRKLNAALPFVRRIEVLRELICDYIVQHNEYVAEGENPPSFISSGINNARREIAEHMRRCDKDFDVVIGASDLDTA